MFFFRPNRRSLSVDHVPTSMTQITLSTMYLKNCSGSFICGLGRGLGLEEAQELTKIARRIAALCLLGPRLDANYDGVKADAYAWPRGKPRSLDSDAR